MTEVVTELRIGSRTAFLSNARLDLQFASSVGNANFSP
jgi:hypothetical protein